MSRRELNVVLGAILTTLAEQPDKSSPRTFVMLGTGLDLPGYEFVERVARDGGLVTTTDEIIQLTPKGVELARKVEELLAGGA